MARFARVAAISAITFTTFVAVVYFVKRYLLKEQASGNPEGIREISDTNEASVAREIGQGDHLQKSDGHIKSMGYLRESFLTPVVAVTTNDEPEGTSMDVDESMIVEVDSDEEFTSTVEVIELDKSSILYQSLIGSVTDDGDIDSDVPDSSSDYTGLHDSTIKSSMLEDSLQPSSVLDESNLTNSYLNTSEYVSAISSEMQTPAVEPLSPLSETDINMSNNSNDLTPNTSYNKFTNSDLKVNATISSINKKQKSVENNHNNDDADKMGDKLLNWNKNYSIDDDNIVSITDSLDSTGDLSDDSLNITETIDEVEANVSSKCKLEASHQEITLDDTHDENDVIIISDNEGDVSVAAGDSLSVYILSDTQDESTSENSALSDSTVTPASPRITSECINTSEAEEDNGVGINKLEVDRVHLNVCEDLNACSLSESVDISSNEINDNDKSRNGYNSDDSVDTVIQKSVSNFVSKPEVAKSSNASRGFTSQDIEEALETSSGSPGQVDRKVCDVLVSLLRYNDQSMVSNVLNLLARVAAFSSKHGMLNEAGCIPELGRLVISVRDGLTLPHPTHPDPRVMLPLCMAITNLAMDERNLKAMGDCVPPLIDITNSPTTKDQFLVSSLHALTNLSILDTHHLRYTPLITKLYLLVDSINDPLRIQCLKVLVNLSCNKVVIPHLLAAKAPECSLSLLHASSPEPILLRWATLLANLIAVSNQCGITAASLPITDKAASPETMFLFLHGVHSIGLVKTRAFILSSHSNEDVRSQATKIYSGLSQSAAV